MPKKVESSLFRAQAQSRKAEQEAIEMSIAGADAGVKRGRPVTKEKTVPMSIRITEERKQKLKVYAAQHGTTISEMIAGFADSLEDE